MQGTKKSETGEEPLEVAILDLKREPGDSFELVRIDTSRGRIDCHYYRAEQADKGVIMVGGIGGGFDTPAENLYPRLCVDLKKAGISSLRVSFRYPTDLTEAIVDVLVGLGFLKAENIRVFGLIGHSFGGAVVVQAAFNDMGIKTVVTLATQSHGISPISLLPASTSVFLIHGEADETLPPSSSVYAYNLAHEPKKIKIYKNAGHGLKEVSDEVYAEVRNWIMDNLK
ncbi:alpha/beta hydrolase [Methanosarcina sp. MSH10X1]|uniref:dienelactone hydrolase family protein n=1 Tax=Methanosarcina sp. MSH10X1 TaxID=2507075 RepID=UPI000FFC15BE|nr:dienelactone hydrolase family protein [Methanosarcina sp. MSH10X1]RXA20477.1 alpha/beta hydrolase [Methanosarcina sp. MSH10X1]